MRVWYHTLFCVDKFYIHVDLFYNFTDVLFSYLVNIQ